MAWDSEQASGTCIDFLEFNQMRNDIKSQWISGNFHAFSSNVHNIFLASSAFARHNWNSSAWKNSGIMWDNSLQKWKPHKSGASTGGASAFIDLTDVPQSYANQIGKIPMVNAAGNGLIFVDIVCVNMGTKTVYESNVTEDPQIVFTSEGVVFG